MLRSSWNTSQLGLEYVTAKPDAMAEFYVVDVIAERLID